MTFIRNLVNSRQHNWQICEKSQEFLNAPILTNNSAVHNIERVFLLFQRPASVILRTKLVSNCGTPPPACLLQQYTVRGLAQARISTNESLFKTDVLVADIHLKIKSVLNFTVNSFQLSEILMYAYLNKYKFQQTLIKKIWLKLLCCPLALNWRWYTTGRSIH
jgi:hypothetical protein